MKDPINSAGCQAKIFKIALPVSLEAVFQTSLGFVDQIIVGTLGATAVAAVGLCNSISFIVMLPIAIAIVARFGTIWSRVCFLNHPVDRSVRASENFLLRFFVEAGFFDFHRCQDALRGNTQTIKENARSDDA